MTPVVDLASVTAGTELPPLSPGTITRATLAVFGPASGDLHPIHVDLDVARSAGLDDVFAHGMLSMAYLGRMLTNWVPQQRIRAMSTRFLSITPLYGEPTCRGVVVAVAGDGADRTAELDITVTLADGTVTLAGKATVALG
ncbi:dehydratase [Gordonia sp. TBRC 11910]|uniref:Dehydratase n=1 Tax=Gordonia asplenii TaxID=2725283 RepID=A0A848KXY9_9ACTN|nr:MaoC/PaaZ C-terminal domain-containing protein [Gordonia asplenii]NMO03614.1 dehydratase [Gordonia asplenii]